jgi:hypothetical protein
MFVVDPAITAVTGTLLGLMGGAATTLYARKMQQDHENKTRFHADKLKLYTHFAQSAGDLAAHWIRQGKAPSTDQAIELYRELQTIRFLGPKPVIHAAQHLCSVISPLEAEEQPKPATIRDALSNLYTAIREDLGIKEESQLRG